MDFCVRCNESPSDVPEMLHSKEQDGLEITVVMIFSDQIPLRSSFGRHECVRRSKDQRGVGLLGAPCQ